MDRKAPGKIMIFETLLIAVAKCYYKSNYDILAFLRDINTNFLEEPYSQSIEIEKNTRRGRKHRIKKSSLPKPKSPIITKETSLDGDDKDTRVTQEPLIDDANMLDYLVSPLKDDFEFGGLIRNLADQRNGNLRMRDMRLRETLRPDSHVR